MRFHLAILFILSLITLPFRAAPDPARTMDEAIAVLFDPHAGYVHKLIACDFLGNMGPAASEAAVPALLRQHRYDMEPVRDRAARALAQILGEAEAAKRILRENNIDA